MELSCSESTGFHTPTHSWALASRNSTVALCSDGGERFWQTQDVTKQVVRLKYLNQPQALFKDKLLPERYH